MPKMRTSFLVQLSARAAERLDLDQVRRMVEYLGGTSADEGFAFRSAVRRDEAIEVLKRQYGSRYFAAADVASADKPRNN